MSADKGPKSALELAMEKLEARDRARGEAPLAKLTEAQKHAISDARAEAKAKIAEWEILRTNRLAETQNDPVKHAETLEQLEIDRTRIDESLESKIRRIKRDDA